MNKLIILIFLTSCNIFYCPNYLDEESFNKSYYTEVSQNRLRTDGVYYTFDSSEVYSTVVYQSIEYRDKSWIDKYYPRQATKIYKAYFISLVWLTENGKVFFSKHGHFYKGSSPGVEVVRKEVDVDSLKYHLLNEKLDYIKENIFTDSDIRGYYQSRGFYRINNNDVIIKHRSQTQHGEVQYENELEAKIVNDSTINYHINLSPITGYHDFIFYKTDIQPSEYFMRLTN